MKTRYLPDRGLTARMSVTMMLLFGLYVVLALVLVWIGLPWPLVAILAIGALVVQYFMAGKVALRAMGAREVTPQEAPELHGIVDRICAMSNTAKPVVAIADTDMPNAFATGRSQEHATICATTGLLRRLDGAEVEAVLAHEMAHVAHRDVMVLSMASIGIVAAGLILKMQYWGAMFGGVGYSGSSSDDRDDNRSSAPVWLVILLASAVVYGISYLLIRVLSRYRELSADRSAAMLTGQPSVLASALVKVSGDMGQIPTQDLRQAETYNAFFLVPALAPGASLSSLFATHPPLEQRLEQLGQISRQLGQAS